MSVVAPSEAPAPGGAAPAADVCRVPGCGRPVALRAERLCHGHEMRLWRGALRPEVPLRPYVRGRGTCRDCGQPVGQSGGHGRCRPCLNRWRRQHPYQRPRA